MSEFNKFEVYKVFVSKAYLNNTSRGIGKGIATQLAMEGATVYITGRNMEALTECAKDIKNKGGNHVIPVKGWSFW